MILLETQNLTDNSWHIVLEILTVVGLISGGLTVFFNLTSKVSVMEERMNNHKSAMMQEISSLKVAITEIKDRTEAVEDKIDQKMQRLEAKIDKLPNDIANTFKTLLQLNKQ